MNQNIHVTHVGKDKSIASGRMRPCIWTDDQMRLLWNASVHIILRLIGMYELTLCLKVYVGEWSISFKLVDQCGTCYKNAIRQVQLSLSIETRIFKYLMHIYTYFNDIFQESRKQSCFAQSKPIMQKKTLHPLHQFGVCVVHLVLACTVFGETECKWILL